MSNFYLVPISPVEFKGYEAIYQGTIEGVASGTYLEGCTCHPERFPNKIVEVENGHFWELKAKEEVEA